MDDPETRRLALAFGAPLAIHAKTIQGSLRSAAVDRGKRVLLFEGGEPRRFSRRAVEGGVAGTLRLLEALGMTNTSPPPPLEPTRLSRATRWVRAPVGGVFRLETDLGSRVVKGQRLGIISSPRDLNRNELIAPVPGLVMGHAVNPLVHRGDALVHLALEDESV
jgi:predicted deacylase